MFRTMVLVAGILFNILFSIAEGFGQLCRDLEPLACSEMAKQNPNMCMDTILATAICPNHCNRCPLKCYNCITTTRNDFGCNTMFCNSEEVCMVKKLLASEPTYELRCASTSACNVRQSRCCSHDLCNTPAKEYYCPQTTYGPNYTMFDLYSDGIRIYNIRNIIFQTKGANDAHILLQNNRNVTSSSVIEIVLGAGNNSYSVMRDAPTWGDELATIKGAILYPNVYQVFWISWSGGCVQVGKGSVVGTSEIMKWCNLTFTISGMRIGYGWGSDGYFKIYI